ncbi:MAG: CarD family transcriptional regulator [Myxococcales bacterium]|nr:CarD family transcriptional regulator [Myxococcales bacterium]
MVSFAVGDLAVYQGQGVGRITEVGPMEVAGASLTVYTVTMESGTIVRVPTHRARDVGLRGLVEPAQVADVYTILRGEPDHPTDKAWNRRHRIYSDKLRSGSVQALAEVTRDLSRLRDDKDLSYGERQMLDQARTLLVRELALATERDEFEVARELEQLLALEGE